MNGQNPDLNNGTNNELNGTTLGPISLGAVQNNPNMATPDPVQIPNVVPNNTPNPTQMPNSNPGASPQVENLNSTPPVNNPVAQPIPGTESLMPGNKAEANNNFATDNNINNFSNFNKNQNIGMIPPQNIEPKKKKTLGKILFVILIIILIIGVAFGVYYFLNISNNTVKLTPKNVSVGLGETIPDNIKEYAIITKGNASICNVNTRNVNTTLAGEYEVTITCGKSVYKTKVIVSDKKAPDAKLNLLFRTVNSTLTVDDFIKSCSDPSNCKTSFVDESKVNEYLKTPGGPYEIEIAAEDDLGNKAIYKTTLYVTSDPITGFVYFTSPETTLTDYKAKKIINDIFPINQYLTFLNVARRDYKYTFENAKVYEEVIGNKENIITFDGVTGIAKYNDKELSLEISTDLSITTLNNENNGSFPTSYPDIQTIYKDTKGYAFSFIKNYPETESEE